MARVHYEKGNEVSLPWDGPEDYKLCLQWATYLYDDKSSQHGYRFIWRRPDGSLQAARGQARIPRLSDAEKLIAMARAAGFGDEAGE